jgi:hypothetical protein
MGGGDHAECDGQDQSGADDLGCSEGLDEAGAETLTHAGREQWPVLPMMNTLLAPAKWTTPGRQGTGGPEDEVHGFSLSVTWGRLGAFSARDGIRCDSWRRAGSVGYPNWPGWWSPPCIRVVTPMRLEALMRLMMTITRAAGTLQGAGSGGAPVSLAFASAAGVFGVEGDRDSAVSADMGQRPGAIAPRQFRRRHTDGGWPTGQLSLRRAGLPVPDDELAQSAGEDHGRVLRRPVPGRPLPSLGDRAATVRAWLGLRVDRRMWDIRLAYRRR